MNWPEPKPCKRKYGRVPLDQMLRHIRKGKYEQCPVLVLYHVRGNYPCNFWRFAQIAPFPKNSGIGTSTGWMWSVINATGLPISFTLPLLETEDEQVQAQGEWLNAHLPKVCPDHPDWFLTPDRPD